eukprot:TRINITY_DN13591_c0_g1_i1.p1 TRINITY_DN13591_c0_g1~~TRINITY_DN13591_c0_g1_i1.p1  ORF type:complete len:123 (-),score=9.08 TRINITY_DN13591_c0_g1_i1:2-370(-)
MSSSGRSVTIFGDVVLYKVGKNWNENVRKFKIEQRWKDVADLNLSRKHRRLLFKMKDSSLPKMCRYSLDSDVFGLSVKEKSSKAEKNEIFIYLHDHDTLQNHVLVCESTLSLIHISEPTRPY